MNALFFAQVAPLAAPAPDIFLGTFKSVVLLVIIIGVVVALVAGIRGLAKRHGKAAETAKSRKSPEARVARSFCDERMEAVDEQLAELASEDRRLAGEIAALRMGMVDMERRINAEDEKRCSEIHKRINALPNELVQSLVNNRKLWEGHE